MAPVQDSADHSVKVLIVDDSVVYRRLIRTILSSMEDVQIAGEAGNGREALDLIEQLKPDILALDVEMPVMGGIETLQRLAGRDFIPFVIMVSAYTRGGAEITFRCLELGAMDFVAKPDGESMAENLKTLEKELRRKISLAQNKVILRRVRRQLPSGRPISTVEHLISPEAGLRSIEDRNEARAESKSDERNRLFQQESDTVSAIPCPCPENSLQEATCERLRATCKYHGSSLIKWPRQNFDLIVIAISTGGPKALNQVIPELPSNLRVPVLIVQHMPEMFTGVLADSLSRKSKIQVREASNGEQILPGCVYIAPGGRQMGVDPGRNHGEKPRIRVTDDPPENHCRPSADYLLRDVASVYGSRALGVVMTGMGCDGTRGLIALKLKGGRAIAQDMKSCVVYGMPGEAIKAGVIDQVIPLDHLARALMEAVDQ